MSLTASMWTSVSGLMVHGEKMNVIGNNISNVNTVGFKAQRMDFQDFVYQYIGTAAGMGQVGRGTSIGIVMNDFSQGSFETTTSSTDIAIQGNGFYCVKPLTNNMSYYTRAGNFHFNKDGYLVDPHGYALQGWKIDRTVDAQNSRVSRTGTGIVGTGSPVDVCLDTFTCPPRHTTQVTLPVNLRYDKVASNDDNSTDTTDPFFSLIKNWDASQDPPLGQNLRAYQTTMEVYDEGGRQHKLTVYFDRVSGSSDPADANYIEGYTDSESYWEFIVTMEPGDDVRDFSSDYDPTGMAPTTPNVPEKLKGLLASGTMTFSSSGALKDMSCFVPQTDPGVNGGSWWSGAAGQEVVDLSQWVAAPINTDGYPVIAPNFSGTAGLQTAYEQGVYNKPNENAEGRLIALDFGISSKNNAWVFAGVANPSGVGGLVAATDTRYGYNRPVTDNAGNYIWTSGGATASAPAGATPSGAWIAATPPSDVSEWYHAHTITGTGVNPPTVTITSNSATPPTLSVVAQNPPHNGTSYGFTSVDGAFTYTSTTAGTNPTAAAIANTTWTGIAGTVATGLTLTDAAGNSLTIPAATATTAGWADPVTPATVTTYLQTTALTAPTVTNATQYNWEITGGGAPVAVNTTDATAPTVAFNATTDNTSEYYWVDTANAAIRATTTANAAPPAAGWTQSFVWTNTGNKYTVNGLDGQASVDPTYATTCLGDNFYEHNGAQQDGYTYGDLRYVSVSNDGVLSAAYSNGETLQLYQIVLYDFPSNQNLRREGGNLFTETRESGVPSSGAAGTGTFGTTHGSSLEQSNADLSREFVNMITTQRGFQANSKAITTVDTMLETVISMKR